MGRVDELVAAYRELTVPWRAARVVAGEAADRAQAAKAEAVARDRALEEIDRQIQEVVPLTWEECTAPRSIDLLVAERRRRAAALQAARTEAERERLALEAARVEVIRAQEAADVAYLAIWREIREGSDAGLRPGGGRGLGGGGGGLRDPSPVTAPGGDPGARA